ncbi:hypothetical protein [Duganella sp. HH101]|uniref:hypothetical protein n=1 Tax=Duganella sp. HH101 TaxID=1781066 RepID=UPI000874AB4B|nr:hypothetical protein [Duganella sp. HH101]OFA05920.1 hypothetical protein DUGA2_15010 [Duganella sp. HH101]
MDYEIILKVTGLAVSIGVAIKPLHDLINGKWSRLREEYRFAKEFFSDMGCRSKQAPRRPAIDSYFARE